MPTLFLSGVAYCQIATIQYWRDVYYKHGAFYLGQYDGAVMGRSTVSGSGLQILTQIHPGDSGR